ncbi:hypothetical protein JCM10296v2_003522 [Rhodotorula toruloides]
MSLATDADALSSLPVDLLTDSLLPAIPAHDLVSLARTCRRWLAFITSEGGPCEILWQRKAVQEMHFPAVTSGRRSGWYRLYARLTSSSAYLWGQTSNGRLGLPTQQWEIARISSLRPRIVRDALTLPTRIALPAPPVSLAAGGWSFHALTADGQVVSWGQMSGLGIQTEDAPLSAPSRVLKPTVLPQMSHVGPVKQIEAGRGHVVMLAEDGEVWEMRTFGRVFEVRDEAGRWGAVSEAGDVGRQVAQVEAGWDHSAVLTRDGEVFVWWQPALDVLSQAAAEAGDMSLKSPTTEGVAFPLSLDTLKAPPLPSTSRPNDHNEKLTLIACGEDFVIGLSNFSNVYFLDISPVPPPRNPNPANDEADDAQVRRARLEQAFLRGHRSWRLMRKFCDVDELAKLEGFAEKGVAPGTRVTHVSAHFRCFAAYSVPSSAIPEGSIVLLGDKDWTEATEPEVIPELQNIGVIKVAHGDYHHLALTSNGRLFSWGAYSAGALGLGHPQLANTPLSLPPTGRESAAPQPDVEDRVRPHPMPRIIRDDQFNQTRGGFHGIRVPTPAARPPQPPERVEKPTRIRFAGEEDEGDDDPNQPRASGKFVYAVTASGWHSGCLAVDLSSSSASAEGDSEPVIRPSSVEADQLAQLQQQAEEEQLDGSRSWFGRLGGGFRGGGVFRVGFAGRGAMRGGAAGRGGGGGQV